MLKSWRSYLAGCCLSAVLMAAAARPAVAQVPQTQLAGNSGTQLAGSGFNGVGRCQGIDAPDSAVLASVVPKPDSKPRRVESMQSVTIRQGAYRLATDEDLEKNLNDVGPQSQSSKR